MMPSAAPFDGSQEVNFDDDDAATFQGGVPVKPAHLAEPEPSFEALLATPAPDAKPAPDSPFAVPAVSPFAAEPHAYPIVQRHPSVDATADVVRAEPWFEGTEAVAKLEAKKPYEQTWIGGRLRTRKSFVDLAKMLAVPAIVAASVGVAVGVYIAYQTPSHAPAAATNTVPAPQPAAPTVEMKATAANAGVEPAPALPAAAESPNAATASAAGDEPQPPSKADDVATQQAAEAQAVAHAGEPGAEPTLTQDAPASAIAAAAAPAPSAPATSDIMMAKVDSHDAPPTDIHEIQTKTGVVKLVDVRINSKPAGATVMLVDDGKTSFLGTTPLATSLDLSHQYDVVFTYQGRPTQMAHLDPSKAARLDVTLHHAHHDAPLAVATESEPKAEAPKAEAKPVAKAEAKPVAKIEATEAKAETPKAKKAEPKAAEPALAGGAGGEGTLMVSTKPPCEILIDGKATGLTTPQRSISLPSGTHKITFVNATQNIKKTVSVSITADKSTKLIQDLMTK